MIVQCSCCKLFFDWFDTIRYKRKIYCLGCLNAGYGTSWKKAHSKTNERRLENGSK